MGSKIKVGIIGGTGFDDPEILEGRKLLDISTPYGKPSDCITEGIINNVPCAILARHGRKHTIPPHHVNYRANIWALKSIGCTHIITSTACGSLKEEIEPGSFVIPDNVIDRTNGRHQTLFDANNPEAQGICHIPMEPAFCNRTRNILLKSALKFGSKVINGGTCVTIQGPRFSTKAESNIFRSWNADIVNMTLIPEVVLAKEAGLCYAALAIATDYDCWREAGENVNATDVVVVFKQSVPKIKSTIMDAVSSIAQENWDDTIKELKEVVRKSIML